nr:hypothetical protein [Candidatus Sigynarchaeota archaeon]
MAKIRYMNTRDRPIYSYTFGHAFIYLLCSVIAVPVGFSSWLASGALFPESDASIPFSIVLATCSSFFLGFVVA